MPVHSADRSSIRTAAVPPATLDCASGAAAPASSGYSAAGSGDDLTKPPVPNSPATATGAADITAQAHRISDAYIYGFDSAGNPTLTDAE